MKYGFWWTPSGHGCWTAVWQNISDQKQDVSQARFPIALHSLWNMTASFETNKPVANNPMKMKFPAHIEVLLQLEESTTEPIGAVIFQTYQTFQHLRMRHCLRLGNYSAHYSRPSQSTIQITWRQMQLRLIGPHTFKEIDPFCRRRIRERFSKNDSTQNLVVVERMRVATYRSKTTQI